MSEFGTIAITRISEFSYGARAFKVTIDGAVVGKLGAGSAAEFPVSPGTHRVQIAVDFYRSTPLSLDVRPGQRHELTTSTGARYRAFVRPRSFLLLSASAG
jgi:hypothetical protein